MKLFVQIPCFNEEKTLPLVVSGLPRKIEGIDEIYTLVIDDGSTDRTLEVAREIRVDYILKNPRNIGLAKTFAEGVDICLSLGADIIVNTDGDNQYVGSNISELIGPILCKKADIVVGCRDIDNQEEFSTTKRILQKLGSYVIRRLSNTTIPDTTSGFRALSRRAAMQNVVMNSFSYTLEMLIQTGRTGQKVEWIPIDVNPKSRPSRLFRSNTHFIYNQIKTIFIVYLFYCPIRFFSWLAGICFFFALLASVRIAYYLWFFEDVQKFKSGTGLFVLLCLILSIIFVIAGLLGSVLSGLRYLLEDLRYHFKNLFADSFKAAFSRDLIVSDTFGLWKSYNKEEEIDDKQKT